MLDVGVPAAPVEQVAAVPSRDDVRTRTAEDPVVALEAGELVAAGSKL